MLSASLNKNLSFLPSFLFSATVLVFRLYPKLSVRPRLGDRMRLLCSVEPADDLVVSVVFVRAGNLTVGPVRQRLSECEAVVDDSYHIVACGPGTNVSSSHLKTYALDIQGMKEADFTSWTCNCTNCRGQKLYAFTMVKKGKLALRSLSHPPNSYPLLST